MGTTILVKNKGFVANPEDLGKKMMGSFLNKLWMSEKKPNRIIFYGDGVFLLAEGTPFLDALDALFKAGVDLIACATCVGYYNLRDKIIIGRVSDMTEFVSSVMKSDKVITV
jgi:intracellular sulfur oxidation DsrE/DsrF family protein